MAYKRKQSTTRKPPARKRKPVSGVRVRTKRQLSNEKRAVYEGRLKQTRSGLKKADLMKNKRGKIVSKKKHAQGVKMYKHNKSMLHTPFGK